MTQIPKIQIRGSFALIVLSAIVAVAALYFSNSYSKKNNEQIIVLEADISAKQQINIDSLINKEAMLKEENDKNNIEISKRKKEDVTKFDKDEFATNLSLFAKANDLKLSKIQQEAVEAESDGFYTVKYNISLNGSMYGMMNFFNLLDGLGNQYSIDYFSFRQEGTYDWLRRENSGQNLLSWVGMANETIDSKKLKEIIDISIKIENDDYDYGSEVNAPVTDPYYDPLQNILEEMMQQESDPEKQQQYEKDKAEQLEKSKIAQAQKQADILAVNEFLKQYYPEGTVIKNGQLIVPMLDGKMVFDVGITFTGNTTGIKPKANIDQYLVSTEAVTSSDTEIKVKIDGKEISVPTKIKGVDVRELQGLVINDSTNFVVSWNNNQLPKGVIEAFLKEKADGADSEINKVASEIRFFQQNGKEELELKKYLIFLYAYINKRG